MLYNIIYKKEKANPNDGKKISDEMKAGYNNLNKLISETIDIIQDVSIASSEQLKGIEQINDAVSILDRVTQENANEANQTTQISTDVESLAKQLVNDANNKKFN